MSDLQREAGGGRRSSRREFLGASAAAVAAAGLTAKLAPAAYAAGSDTVRVGLIGAGGRGTGAARQVLTADSNAKLVAVADAFEDRLGASIDNLGNTDVADQVEVDEDHRFAGFDGYKKVIASDVDLVLLATPPHFRPLHLKAAVEANKHVFAEKPVAVDPVGVRSVLASSEEAKRRGLNVVSGFCWRYETHTREMVGRLHDGAIGAPLAIQATRYGGGVWVRQRRPEMTNMEYQMLNWYYFTWLSGDFNVEQFVHELDRVAWVMRDRYPVSVLATGGRQTRTGEEHGHIYDHFASVFDYEDGARLFASTRHQRNCDNSFELRVLGDKGRCDMQRMRIEGPDPWRHDGNRTDMHQLEQDALMAALRANEPINNGEYMARSTMMGIMERMSAYTGQRVTWEEAMNSQLDLSPPSYDWDAEIEMPEVAMPGITEFV